MVRIDFEIESDRGVFRDAICLPILHGLSDAEIEAIKIKRFEEWKEHLTPEFEVLE
jgi:hypothetical protein